MKLQITNKRLLIYLAKFIGAFCVLYFGTLAIIGLSTPENRYSPFVAQYLNFIPPFRSSLMYGTKIFLSIFGYETYMGSEIQIRLVNGGAVNMVYKCLGYGVTSFWLAFVFANTGTWKKKLGWMTGGAVVLWILNVLRISLVLLSVNKNWKFPFGWDHHTWFNIVAYGAIFGMIWIYDKTNSSKKVPNINRIT